MSREKFIEAVEFATRRHAEQKRKFGNTPYILHSMEVAAIISSVCNDDEVMMAGFLHDLVEDTDTTIDEIRERFGERVTMLVQSETENKRPDLPPEDSWLIRKQESIEELKASTDIGVKILWLGDKLSNIRSMWANWLRDGDSVFEKFHEHDKSRHEWYYRSIVDALSILCDTPAYIEFAFIVDLIFGNSQQEVPTDTLD